MHNVSGLTCVRNKVLFENVAALLTRYGVLHTCYYRMSFISEKYTNFYDANEGTTLESSIKSCSST